MRVPLAAKKNRAQWQWTGSHLEGSLTCATENRTAAVPTTSAATFSARSQHCQSANREQKYKLWCKPQLVLGQTAMFLKSLVVCAVRCEPVSIASSLLSGNLSGNFAKFDDFSLSPTRIETTCQALIGEFPKKANSEFS